MNRYLFSLTIELPKEISEGEMLEKLYDSSHGKDLMTYQKLGDTTYAVYFEQFSRNLNSAIDEGWEKLHEIGLHVLKVDVGEI